MKRENNKSFQKTNRVTRLWGLTGGVATGKSTVAEFLKDEGIPVIDADRLSRELSQPGGAAYSLIVKRFGTGDRESLRQTVFSDPKARKALEEILHPLIQASARAILEELIRTKNPALVFYEAALLVETGRYRELEGLVVVTAPREKRIHRLIQRDGITTELAEKIIQSQATDSERAAAATFILQNNDDLQTLREKTKDLIKKIKENSAKKIDGPSQV